MKDKIVLIGFMLIMTACAVKGGDTTNTAPTRPTPTVTPTPASINPVISSQTSSNGIVGYGFDDPLSVRFYGPNSNQISPPTTAQLVVRGYLDNHCLTAASGNLTFSRSVVAGELVLNNLMYSRAEDIYVGVSAPGSSIACSAPVNVMSAAGTDFTVVTGDAQTATVGTNLQNQIKFKIVDSTNAPVSNAKVHIGTQFSGPSDANGFAYLTYNVGQVAGNLSETSSLTFNGTDLHQVAVSVTAVAATAVTITLGNIQPTTVAAAPNGVTDPYFLMALDAYGNIVYPTLWTLGFGDTAHPFTSFVDSNCTIPGQAIAFEQDFVNSSINPNDTSTWFKAALFQFNNTGDLYLSFNLLDSQGNIKSKVCSNVLTVTP